MRETRLGLAVSVFLHAAVFALCLGLVSGASATPRVVTMGFTLVSDVPRPVTSAPPSGAMQQPRPRQPGRPSVPEPGTPSPPVQPVADEIPPLPDETFLAADAAGETMVRGSDTAPGETGPPTPVPIHGDTGGGADLKPGGKDYNYIRDEVMKNITYPIKARKMGYEGRALVSFIVLENGQTSDITLVESSGYRILDESARQGIARTVIAKRVPYRLIVRLPIVYTLQVSNQG